MMNYYRTWVSFATKYFYVEAKNTVTRTSRVERALNHVFERATENDPESVMAELDDFRYEKIHNY
jgi:hypothetical protein